MRQKCESNEQELGDGSFKPKHNCVQCIHHRSSIHASHQLPYLNFQMKRRKWMQNEEVKSLEISLVLK
jgi:hypothetical protein